jgi:hypothetical protein
MLRVCAEEGALWVRARSRIARTQSADLFYTPGWRTCSTICSAVICCMSSALSEPGGLGLGTLGFPEPVARRMTAEAGFTRFVTKDFDNPINAYYEVRP